MKMTKNDYSMEILPLIDGRCNKKQKHLVIRSLKLSFSPVQDDLFYRTKIKLIF